MDLNLNLNRWIELDALIREKTGEMEEIERREKKTIIAYLSFEIETLLKKAKKVKEKGETFYEFERGKDALDYLDLQRKLNKIEKFS